MNTDRPEKGSRYVWNDSVHAVVKRVARDGTWVDLYCWTSDTAMTWNKRQRLPLPTSFVAVPR